VKSLKTYFHCGAPLQKTLANESSEVESVMQKIKWDSSFEHDNEDKAVSYQTAVGLLHLS